MEIPWIGQLEGRPLVTYSWCASLCLALISVVVGAVAATTIDGGSSGAGFAAVWTSLLILFISVAGTLLLRNDRTEMGIGFLVGSTFMLGQLSFVLFGTFVGLSEDEDRRDERDASRAMVTPLPRPARALSLASASAPPPASSRPPSRSSSW